MTAPIVLTGNRLEIANRLRAGQSIDKITEIGWYRSAWSRQEVILVGWALTFERAEDPPPPPKPKPKPAATAVVLPPRLATVFEYVMGGYVDEEIGRRLGVKPKTAHTYRERIAARLGVPVADIAWAVETGRVVVEGAAA